MHVKKGGPRQPSAGGARTHKKRTAWNFLPVPWRPGRHWGLIGRTAAPDTRFWTRSTAIKPLSYRTSARSYRRCLVMTAATAKNRGQNCPQRTPKWVCAIGARPPIPFNTGIRFSKTCTRIGFLPIRVHNVVHVGSNTGLRCRPHHPVDLLHVQVLLHHPHAPPSGSLAPTTSSSTSTTSTASHCPPLAWCPPPG